MITQRGPSVNPLLVSGRFLPGRCRFKSILMTFQKSASADWQKKKEMYSESIKILVNQQSEVCSALPNKKHMWVKEMLPRSVDSDSVSLTRLPFCTTRPPRFIHLGWLNHTKDCVGAMQRPLIWHFPHHPAGRFFLGFFFWQFAPAWFSQFTPLWLLVQGVQRLHIIPS